MATRSRPPVPVIAVLVVTGVVAAQALLLALFAGIAANGEPRDLSVVVAGPLPAADGFAAQVAAERPGAFDVTQVPDAAAAETALRDREAYAGFVLGPAGMEQALVASAASPAVAQLVTQFAGEQDVPVTDVVPGSPDDPRGAGFSAGFLPLVLTSMLAGVALALAVAGRWPRLLGLGLYGVLAGAVGAAILDGLGVLGGDYLPNAAAIGLIAVAAAAAVTGLAVALGRVGLALGPLLVFLLGNPLSAVAAAPELLPQPWGMVGQWLVPGAGGTLLRSVAWFDGAGAAPAIWVLAGWAAVGVVLVLLGRTGLVAGARRRTRAEAVVPVG